MERRALLEQLAAAILAIDRPHPTRVGIDGYDAAGKTTLASELAPVIDAAGRRCVRVEIDDFHPKGHKDRSIAREYTPESLYAEGYDYASFVELVLEPAGLDGSRRLRPRLLNSFLDEPYPEDWVMLRDDDILLVDGVYLLRPELASHWDYHIWLDVDPDTALARKRVRNIAWTNSEEVVTERHHNRNLPAHRLYQQETNARERADIVIDNNDPESPEIVVNE